MLLTETTDNGRKGRRAKANTVLKCVKPCKIEIPNFIKIRIKGLGAHNPRFHSNIPTPRPPHCIVELVKFCILLT